MFHTHDNTVVSREALPPESVHVASGALPPAVEPARRLWTHKCAQHGMLWPVYLRFGPASHHDRPSCDLGMMFPQCRPCANIRPQIFSCPCYYQ